MTGGARLPEKFQPPEDWHDVLALVETFAASTDAQVWIVGGTVRDALLGRETRDLDLAVDVPALQWARGLADALEGSFVALDGENSVARIVLNGRHVDVAALRGTIDEDLRRRDFTIDALAVRLGGSEPIDITGGLRDLGGGVVRLTSGGALDDDPLRALRGVRIASELRFSIDQATADAIRDRAGSIADVSPERVRDELARMLELPGAYEAVRLLDDLRLLDVVLPELAAGRGITQPADWHVYDVFEHNMHALDAIDLMLSPSRPADEREWMWTELWSVFAWCEPRLRAYLDEPLTEGRSRRALLKLATLLHDVGKPQTRTEGEDGRIRFFGHGDAGAETAGRRLRRLRFSTRETQFVHTLIAEHLRPVQLAPKGEAPSRRALYRFYRDLRDGVAAVLLLSLADAAASRGSLMPREGWAAQVRYMNSLLVRSQEEEGIVSPPRLLSGRDIMREMDESEGPHIGRWLEALREAQAAGEVTDTEGALSFVREFAREEQRQGVERG